VRTLVLTSLTLTCFAANSLLTRGALGAGLIDAPGFTILRLATGAAMLALLGKVRVAGPAGPVDDGAQRREPEARVDRGSWMSAVWLAGYAVAFTLSYARIGASVGALLLFGAVQITMIGASLAAGHRPHARDWIGLALALGGLAWLTLPGATAPDPLGAVLMLAAGACWGGYSIAGRRNRDPLAATTGNFWRAALLAAVALGALTDPGLATGRGVALAVTSGALASGVGYVLWYTVVPALGAWRAALVQLPVPVLTALGAALLLGEPITLRLAIAGNLVGLGVLLSLMGGRRPEGARQR
jgi:drug/metabolite transporter (DMT)-like permease